MAIFILGYDYAARVFATSLDPDVRARVGMIDVMRARAAELADGGVNVEVARINNRRSREVQAEEMSDDEDDSAEEVSDELYQRGVRARRTAGHEEQENDAQAEEMEDDAHDEFDARQQRREEDRQWYQTLREFDARQQRHYSAHPRPGRMTRIETEALGLFRAQDGLNEYMEEVDEEIAEKERQMQVRGEEKQQEEKE